LPESISGAAAGLRVEDPGGAMARQVLLPLMLLLVATVVTVVGTKASATDKGAVVVVETSARARTTTAVFTREFIVQTCLFRFPIVGTANVLFIVVLQSNTVDDHDAMRYLSALLRKN
jgi:hypothetical protein